MNNKLHSKKIMSINTPIFSIAKDLNVESNRILLACKKLGILSLIHI